MSLLPSPSACCTTDCAEATSIAVPGPTGATGAAGTNGTDGENGWSETTASFVMPNEGANVTISVSSSAPFAVGQNVFISVGGAKGTFEVISKPSATSLEVQNLENTASSLYTANSAPTTVFASGALVVPGGIQGASGSTPAGALLSANDLSDVADPATSRTNLGLGTAAVEDVGVSDNGVVQVDQAAGLTSGNCVFATAAGVETKSAADSRTALGLVIGTNVQAYDATLESIASLGTGAGKMLYTTASDTWAESDITAPARALLDDGSISVMRTTLGLNTTPAFVLLYRHETADTVSGGDFTSGSWQTIPLNTEAVDVNAEGSIASNEISLPAGNFRYQFAVCGYQCGTFQGRLYNVTDLGVIPGSYGVVATSSAADGVTAFAHGQGRFSLASAKTIRLEGQCSVTKAGSGLGLAGSFGGGEVYSWLLLEREINV